MDKIVSELYFEQCIIMNLYHHLVQSSCTHREKYETLFLVIKVKILPYHHITMITVDTPASQTDIIDDKAYYLT